MPRVYPALAPDGFKRGPFQPPAQDGHPVGEAGEDLVLPFPPHVPGCQHRTCTAACSACHCTCPPSLLWLIPYRKPHSGQHGVMVCTRQHVLKTHFHVWRATHDQGQSFSTFSRLLLNQLTLHPRAGATLTAPD